VRLRLLAGIAVISALAGLAACGHEQASPRRPGHAAPIAQALLPTCRANRALAQVGLDLSHVVKVTAHLADLSDFAAYNAVYERLFPAPYPVRTTVGSQLHGILVEIDVVAALP